MAVTEHWNYDDSGKDFHGGYAFMSQGPLPVGWAQARRSTAACGAWRSGRRCRATITWPGFGSSARPSRGRHNRVELADEKDQFGLPIAA